MLDNCYRPRYHFTAPKNWINDPNGLVEWNGTYHLYYQHNPGAAVWGDMHWGHASSTDMVNWSHHPLAIYPDKPYDADGVFSGIGIPMDDHVEFLYTGVRGEDHLPCLAIAYNENLENIEKLPENPLFHPPEDIATTIFRDHSVFKIDGTWFQVIGSGIEGHGGNCMLYRSSDFRNWEFVGPLVADDLDDSLGYPGVTGWECPDMFPLGDAYVLMMSHWDNNPMAVMAYVGSFDGVRFVPSSHQVFDAGTSFYAPQSFTDSRGRRVQFGWLREVRPVDHHAREGWAGCMSIPRELYLTDQGTLGARPVAEVLSALEVRSTAVVNNVWQSIQVGTADPRSFVLDVNLPADAHETLEIELLRTEDDTETTVIQYDPASTLLTIDTTKSSADPNVPGERIQATVSAADHLQVFVDVSALEVFVGNKDAHASRMYPTRDDATGLRIRGPEGTLVTVSEVVLN